MCLFLGACSGDALLDRAYPDRQRFQFNSADGETRNTYRCAVEGSTTRDRARAAHEYVETNIRIASEKAAEQLVSDLDAGKSNLSASLTMSMSLNQNTSKIAENTEALFRCILSDVN